MAHLLEMKNICKSFSGVSVLKNNHLELEAGEVHALLGENGAGKSTLIKILGGVYTKDSGQILVDGQEVEITGVESAKEHGIRIIHQELMLIPDMTISENIFIGQEPKTKAGTVDKKKMNEMAQGFLDSMHLDLKSTQFIRDLNIAQQQMVEIIRAISFGATVTNLFNVVRQITINLFLACGMTFVILLAGIDLSVGSVIAVSGCISAGLISWNGLPVYVGILGGILAGVVIGLINGYIVSSTNIPAFIVTLAMMNIGRGIARVYTKAQTISVLDDSYTFWGMGTIFGIPIQLYCIVAVIAVSSFILNKTKLGRHIYAVGGNKQAAEYSGINVKKVTFFVFVYSALLASLAGILTVGRTFTAMMTLGDGAEMDAISAVVLGGTSMNGGRGTIAGTVIGAIVIGVLKNGMNLLGIDSSWQYIVQGIVILIAVYIDWFKQTGFKFSRKIKA